MSKRRLRRARDARGLTLTEMMVGLAAGLVVTLAGTTGLLLARQGFNANSDQSSSLDAGRLALDLLARNVRMAGSPAFDPTTFNVSTVLQLPGGAVPLQGVEGSASPDSLTVRFWSNQAYSPTLMVGADCLGQAVGVGMVVNTFSVSSSLGLACVGNGTGSTGTPLAVAGQVTDLQLLYGLANAPEANSAERFVNATTVTSEGAWARVRSVDICLEVMATDPRAGAGASPGLNCRGQAFASDNRLRRIYRTTVNVRNYTTGNIFPGNTMP